jgi:hypothetical protein
MSRYVREGERAPLGYGLVGWRPEYLGAEIAPMPWNWIKRFIYWATIKSRYPMTRDELRTQKAVRALMIEAEAKGREAGYREGSQAAWGAVTKIYMDGAYGKEPMHDKEAE